MLKLVDHPDDSVRFSLTSALAVDVPEAVAALVKLTADPDEEIRNWSTFGLGTLVSFDTPEIREALKARLNESESEIRGEALIGLANRRDPKTRTC